ncbi:MAG: hypothetical protein ABI609_10545 [Acidobacteriota bacterium]
MPNPILPFCRLLRTGAWALALAFALQPTAMAADWGINPDTPKSTFEDFHKDFAAAVYPYAEHGAKPLGLVGFEVYVDASYNHGFGDDVGPGLPIYGSLPGGILSLARVGVRKGLPLGFDVEATYGRAVGSDLNIVSGTVQWALLEGGVATPALAFRLTGSKSTGVSYYSLRQLGAEAILSKGFAMLTPYVGAGMVRSESRFRFVSGRDVTSTEPILFGGVTISALIPKINIEVQKGRGFQATVKVGFGL